MMGSKLPSVQADPNRITKALRKLIDSVEEIELDIYLGSNIRSKSILCIIPPNMKWMNIIARCSSMYELQPQIFYIHMLAAIIYSLGVGSIIESRIVRALSILGLVFSLLTIFGLVEGLEGVMLIVLSSIAIASGIISLTYIFRSCLTKLMLRKAIEADKLLSSDPIYSHYKCALIEVLRCMLSQIFSLSSYTKRVKVDPLGVIELRSDVRRLDSLEAFTIKANIIRAKV